MNEALDFQHVDLLVVQLKELVSKAFRSGQAIDQTELDLHKQLMALGHALIGAIIERAGEGNIGPTIEKKGRVFNRMPKRTRRYRSIFGEFKIQRYVYGTTPDQAIQAIPLDEHLGLPENDYSLVFELWIGSHATESSFHKAVELLERITTLHVPVDSAERIGNRLGKSAASVLDNPPSIDRATEAELLVQTSDNKGIPMVRKKTEKPPVGAPIERMGPKPGQKQMACMAGVYTVDRNVRTAQEVIDALFHEPKSVEPTKSEVKAKNPRYFGALTKHDSDGNVIGKSAEEQAQQWLTANTLRRHRGWARDCGYARRPAIALERSSRVPGRLEYDRDFGPDACAYTDLGSREDHSTGFAKFVCSRTANATPLGHRRSDDHGFQERDETQRTNKGTKQ